MTDSVVAALGTVLNLSIRSGVTVIVALPTATTGVVSTLASATETANREHPRTAHGALTVVWCPKTIYANPANRPILDRAVTGLSGWRS